MVGMNAIEVAMGYYRRAWGDVVWRAHWGEDVERARDEGLLVLCEQVVVIAWPVECDFTEEGGDTLYVHRACGRLGALGELVRCGELDLRLWRWCCWQRGLRSARWHWGETGRMVEKL